MLKRILHIDLKNFQAHADTSIDVDSNVVVLSGETDNGKTSIVRALNWLITNRPTGDGFVSKWVKHRNKKDALVMNSDAVCSVTVKVLDDNDKVHTVTRAKTATENYYEVDGTKLSAIGTDVPKEVRDLLSMHDENYQDQDEKYYLLTLTGSQVSSKLNELVHLDTIDDAYALLKRKKLDESSDMKSYDKLVTEHRVAVDSLKHIPTLVEEAKDLEELIESLTACQDTIDDITSLCDEMEKVESRLERLPDVSRLQRKIERVSSLIDDLNDTLDDLDDASDDYDRMRKVNRNLKELPDVSEMDIKCLSDSIAEYNRVHAVVDDIHHTLHEVEDVAKNIPVVPTKLYEEWMALDADYRKTFEELKVLVSEHKELWVTLENLRYTIETEQELKEDLPELCPLCGQPMKEHSHG